MTTKIDLSKTNGISLQQPTQSDRRSKFEKLPTILHACAATFLAPKDILSATMSCKTLQTNLSSDRVWKSCMLPQLKAPSSCTTKAEFLAYQSNIANVTYALKEIPYKTASEISYYSSAHSDINSNCFLAIGKNSQFWDIFDLDGTQITSIDLDKTQVRIGVDWQIEIAHLSQDTILLIYAQRNRRSASLFSRQTGAFLHTFDLPISQARQIILVAAIYGDTHQIVLLKTALDRATDRTVLIYDFNGEMVAKQDITGKQFYFCKETRSTFHITDNTVCEQPLSGKSRKCCELPKFTHNPCKYPTPPTTQSFMANAHIICAYSNYGEIRVWDYATGKPLSTFAPGYCRLDKRAAFESMKLLQDKVCIRCDTYFIKNGHSMVSTDNP